MNAENRAGRRLTLLPFRLSVCRLEAEAAFPAEVTAAPLWSATRTAEELSVVVPAGMEPAGAQVEAGWLALKAEGPIAFSELGVLAGFTRALAAAGVSVFALSTYDTDYLLFKEDTRAAALDALRAAGYVIR